MELLYGLYLLLLSGLLPYNTIEHILIRVVQTDILSVHLVAIVVNRLRLSGTVKDPYRIV